MWESVFLIAAWLTITPPSGMATDTTSVMLLEFNRSMSIEGLFDTENYSITDNQGDYVPIYKIEVINSIDGIAIPDTSLIGLQIPKAKYKTAFNTEVNNLMDKSGRRINLQRNKGWYYHSGFVPKKFGPIGVSIR